MAKYRVAIDVNVFVSYFLGSLVRDRLERVLFSSEVELFACAELFEEITQVLRRPKFRKYFSEEQATFLVETLAIRCRTITIGTVTTSLSRDPKDEYLLKLAEVGELDFLITGDADLLTLHPFGNTSIFTLAEFCNQTGI